MITCATEVFGKTCWPRLIRRICRTRHRSTSSQRPTSSFEMLSIKNNFAMFHLSLRIFYSLCCGSSGFLRGSYFKRLEALPHPWGSLPAIAFGPYMRGRTSCARSRHRWHLSFLLHHVHFAMPATSTSSGFGNVEPKYCSQKCRLFVPVETYVLFRSF